MWFLLFYDVFKPVIILIPQSVVDYMEIEVAFFFDIWK